MKRNEIKNKRNWKRHRAAFSSFKFGYIALCAA